MYSIDTAAVWRTPALVESSVIGTPAARETRRSAAGIAQTVGAPAIRRSATRVEAIEANRMMHRATFDNAAKNKAVAFAATPAAGYGHRPRGTPLS